MHAGVFDTGHRFVDDAMGNTVPSATVNELLLQLIRSHFGFCVMSGNVVGEVAFYVRV